MADWKKIEECGRALIDFIIDSRNEKMADWEIFEEECTKYLNNKYGALARFEHKGKSDSTIPDIEVNTKTGNRFFIEAKHCPAQCGQFVLLPNISKGIFEYSPLNATPINEYSKAIMAYMNSDFEAFKEAGTSGKDIAMKNSSDIFASWIITTYKNKGAKFIITNGNVVFPIEKFAEYFYVSAKYRIKRSGSSSVGKGNLSAVSTYIDSHISGITRKRIDKDKLFVTSNRSIHDTRFVINGTEYMISLRDNEYEVRKLSNTFNANVIFSIDLKAGKAGLKDAEIIASLR